MVHDDKPLSGLDRTHTQTFKLAQQSLAAATVRRDEHEGNGSIFRHIKGPTTCGLTVGPMYEVRKEMNKNKDEWRKFKREGYEGKYKIAKEDSVRRQNRHHDAAGMGARVGANDAVTAKGLVKGRGSNSVNSVKRVAAILGQDLLPPTAAIGTAASHLPANKAARKMSRGSTSQQKWNAQRKKKG